MIGIKQELLDKYIDSYIRCSSNYGHYKIKEVTICKVEQIIGFEIIVVDYKVFLYKSGLGYTSKADLFTPNTYSCVDGTLTIDLADPQTKRDILLTDIIS